MGRLQKKKNRAHVTAAHSTTAKSKAKPSQSASISATSALGAAAVVATFGDDDKEPIDNEQSDDDDDVGTGEGEQSSALSRGQRKRMKRRSAFMKKMGLVNRVTQEKAKEANKQKLGVFADLEELQESLFLSDKEAAALNKMKKPAASQQQTTSTKKKALSGKQRQKLAVRELGQLRAVHSHPSFQDNPFEAIQKHLQNTVVQANQENLNKTNAAANKKAAASATAMDTE